MCTDNSLDSQREAESLSNKFIEASASYFSLYPLETRIPTILNRCFKNTMDEIANENSAEKIKEIVMDHCYDTLSMIEYLCEMHMIYHKMSQI